MNIVLGIFLLILPFLCIFAYQWHLDGFKETFICFLFSFGVLVFVTLCVSSGFYLLDVRGVLK